MFAYVLQVYFNALWTMRRVVNFDTINRHIDAQFIQQSRVVESKARFMPTGMCNEANSPAPMCHLDCLSHNHLDRMIAHLANHFQSSGPAWSIAMLAQQDSII